MSSSPTLRPTERRSTSTPIHFSAHPQRRCKLYLSRYSSKALFFMVSVFCTERKTELSGSRAASPKTRVCRPTCAGTQQCVQRLVCARAPSSACSHSGVTRRRKSSVGPTPRPSANDLTEDQRLGPPFWSNTQQDTVCASIWVSW